MAEWLCSGVLLPYYTWILSAWSFSLFSRNVVLFSKNVQVGGLAKISCLWAKMSELPLSLCPSIGCWLL